MAKKKTGSTKPKATPRSKQRRSSARLAKAAEVEQAGEQVTETQEPELPLYKEDNNAFNTPIEDGKDYISSMPSEMLDRILGYCVMDHEPELAARQRDEGANFVKRPHVFLSLAAMSTHFKAHVESFSRLELTRNKDFYRFKTTAEIVESGNLRRSPRIKAKPPPDHRCYRMELITRLQTFCVRCGYFTDRFAVMANSMKCDALCERMLFPGVIDLTTALRTYDLRDWMLIKTRKPGPRAKMVDLPNIHYATVRCGNGTWTGMRTSYRFFDRDAKAIAKIVHGDIDEHMAAKGKQRYERRVKKRREVHRELKVRYHTDMVEYFGGDEPEKDVRDYHQERLTHYTSAEYDLDGGSEVDEDEAEYGYYGDVHSRLCLNKENCFDCWEDLMRKYHDWF